ncbi:hypothetical protein WG906_16835 [Pedobacter sp. P351]|uniref:hypothetical protein n=1 Tax=Pedobacter superstes TaxID=3133441 RepID=UPI0030A24B47
MTFEEFFTKKRIDLVQLEKAEPVLYSEFKSHFAAMGEKSFDHTKKFWFNKLRGLYHLAHPEKAIPKVEEAIAAQAEPLSSPTIEQRPFTPRFKSANISKTEPSEEALETKPAAKPAFRSRNIPVKESEEGQNAPQENSENIPPITKPAFRPRNIPVKQSPAEGEDAKTESPPIKKPGFKPVNVKPASEENASDSNKTGSPPDLSKPSETSTINKGDQQELAKEGYKPKFRLKNTKNPSSAEEESAGSIKKEIPESEDFTVPFVEPGIERKISSSTDQKTPEQEIQDNNIDLRGTDDTSQDEKPKPAYKPKFNLKNIKKPNADQ